MLPFSTDSALAGKGLTQESLSLLAGALLPALTSLRCVL
jgi:hypothetical protein